MAAFNLVETGNCVFTAAPPAFRCGSSASRMTNSLMISLDPSKMVLTLASRIIRSTGRGVSPLSVSDCWVSYPLPPQVCNVWSMLSHDFSVPHILQIAASRRMSAFLSLSTCREVMAIIASMANVLAAMRLTLSAIAACLPMGDPHWMRLADHDLVILIQRFEMPTQAAGMLRRPALSVVRATFNPRPSPAMMFFLGILTSVNLMTPL